MSPKHVAAVYILNPLTIATCVSMSTGLIHNFILALVLLFILHGAFITQLLLLYLICVRALIVDLVAGVATIQCRERGQVMLKLNVGHLNVVVTLKGGRKHREVIKSKEIENFSNQDCFICQLIDNISQLIGI